MPDVSTIQSAVTQAGNWSPGQIFASLVGGGMGIAWLGNQAWKMWVKKRLDDGGMDVAGAAASAATAANTSATSAFAASQQQIQQQQTRINSLESRIDTLESRLNQEVSARISAQTAVGQLQIYIQGLHAILTNRGIAIPEMPKLVFDSSLGATKS